MLSIPAKYVEDCAYKVEQIFKRAKNTLEGMASKRYVITRKKGWFSKEHYEVNVFGEIAFDHGTDRLLEALVENDKLSPMDYQLLKFYDYSESVEALFNELRGRKIEDGTIGISMQELGVINDLATFEEDPNVTKEDILRGEQLREASV